MTTTTLSRQPQRWRNLGIIAHIDAGKTTLTERLLWKTGQLHRVGEVHEGNTTMDHMDIERERGITIGSAATQCTWSSPRYEAHRLTIIDTPGHIDFSIEVERSLRVLDGAVAVFCAVGGVQPQSETVWRQARRHGVPLLAFVNKMDRTGADMNRVVGQMRERLGATPVVLVSPIGMESGFQGLVDLVGGQVCLWTDEGQMSVRDWTAEEAGQHASARQALIDAVADHDDTVLDAVLSGEVVEAAVLRAGVRRATLAGRIVPVLAGSAFRHRGIELLLDAVVDFLPSPVDRPAVAGQNPHGEPVDVVPDAKAPSAGLVFKVAPGDHGALAFVRLYRGTWKTGDMVVNATRGTDLRLGRLCTVLADAVVDVATAQAGEIVAVMGWKDVRTGDTVCASHHPVVLETIQTQEPVLAWRLGASRQEDLARLGTALDTLTREDPSLRVGTDPQTGEVVLWGMGELHLDVTVERLRREHGVRVQVGEPCVAYRETLGQLTGIVESKLAKQTGGKGQFARLVVTGAPREDGEVVVVDTIKGGVVPKEFLVAAEKGMREALSEGPQGYPVVGLTITVVDGEVHSVDSSAQAFHRAGSLAAKAVMAEGGSVLLEPVMRVRVFVPVEQVGEVMGDIQRRRGQLVGMEDTGLSAEVEALVPLASLQGYTTSLRSMTQGRGSSTMELNGYAPAPGGPKRSMGLG